MFFHSATISTIFKDHFNSLLTLQISPVKVNTTNKISKFIGFMKSAGRSGHSKENFDLYASPHHQKIVNAKIIY